jgi:putative addiction module component (TIGR02574 family)
LIGAGISRSRKARDPRRPGVPSRLPEGRNRAGVVDDERLAKPDRKSVSCGKVELLDAVSESLEADALPLTEAQRAELDYRIARHEQNPSDVIPWEQVKADLFRKP